MSDAKYNLENKKKWIRMPFDQGDSRQADSKVSSSFLFFSMLYFLTFVQLKDFENTFSNCRNQLDVCTRGRREKERNRED